ncbi:hypothetical protein EGW08_021109 [Elysia chlorotica]|uniref:Uncharacterized protein n=1 Tax=Elysia chlorotica TaxID=188477 RepID=A0A3S0Z7H2_ELYCH|nr:hypothetical protein EGW08_021109 [Elysia chlorotica]
MTCSNTMPPTEQENTPSTSADAAVEREVPTLSAQCSSSSEDEFHELPLSAVRKIIRAGKAVLEDEICKGGDSSSDEYVPPGSYSCSDFTPSDNEPLYRSTPSNTPSKPAEENSALSSLVQLRAAQPSTATVDVPVEVSVPTPQQINEEEQSNQEEEMRGRRRKRRTKEERDAQATEKLNNKMRRHSVLEGCSRDKCRKKCHEHFNERTREEINNRFWRMDYVSQKLLIRQLVTVRECKERKKDAEKYRKGSTKSYTFRKSDGEYQSVCQLFFLNTLGLKGNNDKITRKAFEGAGTGSDQSTAQLNICVKDNRGSRRPVHKIDHNIIHDDIEQYQPSIPHYRREHAPLRRYLPTDLNLPEMYKRFMNTGKLNISYNTYYQAFKEMNISFAKLGNEECEVCTEFELHKKSCVCRPECLFKKKYDEHERKYKDARTAYKMDSSKAHSDAYPIFSADLQKVVMLPMIEQFKRSIFTRRLCCFNETFAPVGKMRKNLKDIAVIWHEAIAGRKDEDIASAYAMFLKSQRDARAIILWLDNCGAQNKNWTLFTMLVTLINSPEMYADSIVLKYFEPGHSFMSADTAHSKIESVFRRKRKIVYDFRDLSDCVKEAGCTVFEPQHTNFEKWVSGMSQHQMRKSENRPYLSDMVSVEFKRGKETLSFKNNHQQEDAREVAFLKASHDINSQIGKYAQPRGVEPRKKQDILSQLVPLMPESRRPFWENLPVNVKSRDLNKEVD